MQGSKTGKVGIQGKRTKHKCLYWGGGDETSDRRRNLKRLRNVKLRLDDKRKQGLFEVGEKCGFSTKMKKNINGKTTGE